MRFVSIGSSPLMRFGILAGLRQCGHTAEHFPHHGWLSLEKDEGSHLLSKYIQQYKPDYLIFAGYGPAYFSVIPKLCKAHGVGFIYWAIEDPVGFERTLSLAKQADYVFTTTIECIPKYEGHGITASLLMFACNPQYHKAGQFCTEYDTDLALAASFYHWKTRKKGYETILEAAKESGQSLMVWGAGWQKEAGQKQLGDPNYFKGYFPNGRLPDLCASAKIILGIQCDGSSKTQTAMRPYEVLGCKGFHLTQWTKATKNIFKDGRHLVTARTKEEAADKIKYYLNHPDSRAKIAAKGQAFVYKHHTYAQRVRQIILPRIGI